MAIEQTAETGHDITLATHLVKNFDGYGEELNEAFGAEVMP